MPKLKVVRIEDVDVNILSVDAGVRYWEDATVNGVDEDNDNPKIYGVSENGTRWKVLIDLNEGKILNWPEGMTADVHYKVCDDGVYRLQNNGEIVKTYSMYVPRILSPSENGYGDYIIMSIDGDGKIQNFRCDLESFESKLADELNEIMENLN